VPLHGTLGYPPDAEVDQELGAGAWHEGYTPDIQADWASDYLALVPCEPFVRGVRWPDLCDAHPHQFPHAGFFDERGNSKPVVERLRELRQEHLR
jgi:hypothetical protein